MAPPSDDIPLFYKLFFLYLEPLSALTGAYYACYDQQTYLDLSHALTAPKYGIPTGTTIILNQLANLYFFFAINEALVLRATDDVRVWCSLLTGLLVADFGHLYSVSPLGSQIYWNVSEWNAIDCGNIAFVYLGATMRIAFLLRAWIQSRPSKGRRRSRRGKTLKAK